MSTRLLGRPTGASPIVSARHSSFPRALSPNEARWEPRRGVIPELLLDRTALRSRQPPAHRLDKTLIARGRGTPEEPMLCHRSRCPPPPSCCPALSPDPARAASIWTARRSGATVWVGSRLPHRDAATRQPPDNGGRPLSAGKIHSI